VKVGMPSSPQRANILRCRERGDQCRSDAEAARTAPEEEAWLALAEDWDRLADAFEQAEGSRWWH
jgi:hypothetical protein